MAFDVRRLGPDDLPAYRALRLRGLAAHPDAFTSSADEEAAKPAESLARRLAHDPSRPQDALFGAFDGAALVGVAGVDVDPRAKTRHKGHVYGMFVDDAHAGRGIGRSLVGRVIAHATDAGLRQLVLTVTAGNHAAQRLYERAGFAACGREPQAVVVDGRALDKITMVLFLPAAHEPRPPRPFPPEPR